LRELIALFPDGTPDGLRFERTRFRSAEAYATFLLKTIQYASAYQGLAA
jgi:hypothetical protein